MVIYPLWIQTLLLFGTSNGNRNYDCRSRMFYTKISSLFPAKSNNFQILMMVKIIPLLAFVCSLPKKGIKYAKFNMIVYLSVF